MSVPRLTAVVPTAGRWTDLEHVIEVLLPAVDALGLEVIAVSGGDDRDPPIRHPGVIYARAAAGDVFAARAAGVMLATGEVVALLEDHALPHPNWAAGLLAAWEDHPDADALVNAVEVGPGAGPWEVALFTLTFGPFLGVTDVPRDRLPVPGNVSFRRSLLPDQLPAPGWLEYDLLGSLVRSGRMAMIAGLPAVHVQPAGWRVALLSYHSGRMYAGCTASKPAVGRAGELRRLRREASVMVAQTIGGRRRSNGGLLGRRFIVCTCVVLCANLVGQLVGIATRSAGSSATQLE